MKQQSVQHLNADVETVPDIALFERLSTAEKQSEKSGIFPDFSILDFSG